MTWFQLPPFSLLALNKSWEELSREAGQGQKFVTTDLSIKRTLRSSMGHLLKKSPEDDAIHVVRRIEV
jgi:hypothetical protein